MPRLSLEVQEELKRNLPVAGGIFTNPLDTTNLTAPEPIATAIQVLGRVPDIHMLVYHIGFHPASSWGLNRFNSESFLTPVTGVMREFLRATGKPVLLALRPPQDMYGMPEFLAVQQAFVEAGFPVFYSMRRLARAIARIVARNRSLGRARG
jgi:hypothetical protein